MRVSSNFRFIIFFVIITLFLPMAIYANKSVIVIPFKSREVAQDIVNDFYTNFLKKLIASKEYKVIAPEKVIKLMNEKGFTESDVFDKDNAIEIGKAANVEEVITCNVNKIGNNYYLTINTTDINSYITRTNMLKAKSESGVKDNLTSLVKKYVGATTAGKEEDIGRKKVVRKKYIEDQVTSYSKGGKVKFTLPKISPPNELPQFLPVGKIAIRTLDGVWAIKAGQKPERLNEDEFQGLMTALVEQITSYYQPQPVVTGKAVKKANYIVDQDKAANKCQDTKCLDEFAKQVGARLVITGEISVERGTYYLFLKLIDVQEGALVGISGTMIPDKKKATLVKKVSSTVLELFEEYLFEPPKKVVRQLPGLGEILISTKHPTQGVISGCDIYLNGRKLTQRTPTTIRRLPVGRHNIFVVKDFMGAEVNIEIPTEEHRVELLLGTVYADRVYIETQPKGAQIFLDGQYKGTSPLELVNFKFGKYRMEVRKEDYEYIDKSIIINEKQMNIKQTLRIAGTLQLRDCPPDSTVYINNDDYNYKINGNTKILLAPGQWQLSVEASNYKTKNDKVNINARQIAYYSPFMCYTEAYLNKQIEEIRKEQRKNWIWIWVGVGGFVTFTGISIFTQLKRSDALADRDSAWDMYLQAATNDDAQKYYTDHKHASTNANEYMMWETIGIIGALSFAGVAGYYYYTMPGDAEIKRLEGLKSCFIPPINGKDWSAQIQYTIRF